jgi:hypothetical protein
MNYPMTLILSMRLIDLLLGKEKSRQKVVLGILTGPELTGAHDF